MSDEVYNDMIEDLEELFEELGFVANIVKTSHVGASVLHPIACVRIGTPKRNDEYARVGDADWIVRATDFDIKEGDLLRTEEGDQVVMEADKIKPARVLVAWKLKTSNQ